MQQQFLTIGEQKVQIFTHNHPEVLLVQPTSPHQASLLVHEAAAIEACCPTPFAFAAFAVTNWERALAPWPDHELSRREDVGTQGHGTLAWIDHLLLPALQVHYGHLPTVLGGYSLAALFALWASCESTAFHAIAAASPSVWLKAWPQYALTHSPHASWVYLSLGDREEKTRNPTFARIGSHIRDYHRLLASQIGDDHTLLEWNTGNHFANVDKRTAKAFAWCLSHIAASNR